MVAVIDVLLATVTPVADVPPTVTVAPERKPVPVMVTDVPPEVVPDVGEIELTSGAGFDAELFNRTKFATEGTPVVVDDEQHVVSGWSNIAVGRPSDGQRS